MLHVQRAFDRHNSAFRGAGQLAVAVELGGGLQERGEGHDNRLSRLQFEGPEEVSVAVADGQAC